MNTLSALITTMKSPESANQFSLSDWDHLIRQAYATKTLARLYFLLDKMDVTIPQEALWHFNSADQVVTAHQHDVHIEIEAIKQAFAMGGLSPIFLKGTAYCLDHNIAAKGRVFSDVDVYIPKHNLQQAEQLLRWHGWVSGEIDQHDENYYRRWMHEIPPMQHRLRRTTVDLHHSLLPLSSRIQFKLDRLQNSISSTQKTLSPIDKVLHSATHLLVEGEFDKAFRDLSDIDLLLKEYGDNDAFWKELTARSQELGLGRILFYALRYSLRFFSTPVPETTIKATAKHSPNRILLLLMDQLFAHVLTSPLGIDKSLSNKAAHYIMYLRGHWLRMPLHLLIPHLLHKSLITPYQERKKNKSA